MTLFVDLILIPFLLQSSKFFGLIGCEIRQLGWVDCQIIEFPVGPTMRNRWRAYELELLSNNASLAPCFDADSFRIVTHLSRRTL